MMRAAGFAAGMGAALLAAPAFAGPPELVWPLDCKLGESCFIEDYVDTDPGSGVRDYACGIKSRDGHRGTDIALLSFEAMEGGMTVRAAAAGTVAAVRDGVKDAPVTAATRAALQGRECGNGVRIDHGRGWQTLYCHMKRGSIGVRKGTELKAGAPLGAVGLSGLTNAPHLHFSVLRDGRVIDPFRPEPDATCDAEPGAGLWREAPGYDRAGLFTAGFATEVPTLDEVQTGSARVLDTDAQSPLVLYGHVFHARPGDRLVLTARGPQGEVFSKSLVLDDPQSQLFRAFGRKSPEGGWPAGAYRGYVTLSRAGRILAVRHADIEVTR